MSHTQVIRSVADLEFATNAGETFNLLRDDTEEPLYIDCGIIPFVMALFSLTEVKMWMRMASDPNFPI